METQQFDSEKPTSSRKPASKTVPGVILRIVLVLITGSVIGGAIYFRAVGWIPYLEQRVFQPIDAHQQQIQDLLASQGMLETQVADLSGTLIAVRSEGDQDLQATQAALAESLTSLKNSLDSLASDVSQYRSYSATLIPGLLSTSQAHQGSLDRNLSALATAQMADARSKSREIDLLQVLALLTRADQYLLADNYGSAEEVLATTRDYLLEISGPPVVEEQLLSDLVRLVTGAAADLPYRPQIAAGKLELAWQLAYSGLTEPDQTGTLTPTPSNSAGPTLTPTPTPN